MAQFVECIAHLAVYLARKADQDRGVWRTGGR
jgi:hypothetical protein